MRATLKALLGDSSTVTVNGRTYPGRNVSIIGSRVFIDGVEQSNLAKQPKITVVITGDCQELLTERGDVTVNGSAGSIQAVSGDVRTGDVAGNVSTVSGDVECGRVSGDVSTVSGDIKRGLL